MKFTLSWLKEFLETDSSLDEISKTLTSIGLEVEEIIDHGEILKPFTVAEILETKPHPDADKLQICKVNSGNGEELSIVCGAPNARAGIKVPLAREGSIIPVNGMKIKKSKIRGIESNGMLCSAAELNVAEDAEGILELPENASVGEEFAKYIGKDDCLIEIAITPNRGDCLGVYGIARDLAAAGIGSLKEFKIPEYEEEISNPIKINIENEAKCPLFIGVYIEDVENKESPEWLKNKLESIGKKPISALVDITNYLTFCFGRPAHIYDADKLDGDLTVRQARNGEKITALDEKEYLLNENITIIADNKSPQAIAGVIGALDSGCEITTKNAYLEIALFDADIVSLAGRKLQIDSDARYRFERTVDPKSWELYKYTISLIQEICGGKASNPEINGNKEFSETIIDADYDIINSVTGLNLKENEIDSILNKLGFKTEGKGAQKQVIIPSFRPDISINEDLIEEVARIYGYDEIPTIKISSNEKNEPSYSPNQKRVCNIRRLVASRDSDEIVSFSFMANEKADLYSNGKSLIEVANPISEDLSIMRPSLIPNLVDAIAKNNVRKKEAYCFFEIGNIFSKNTDNSFNQELSVGKVKFGYSNEKSAIDSEKEFDIYDIKVDIEEVINLYLDPSSLRIEKNNDFSYYHPGRSGIYKMGKNIVAVFGELHPKIAKEHGLKEKVICSEIFLDNLPKAKNKKDFSRKAPRIFNFQAVERDFAFLIDKNLEAQDIILAVKKAKKNLINEVKIFDLYEGEKIEEGKKSIAIRVRIQPEEATLNDNEIEEISDAIINSVSEKTGASLRK